jgi:hypothetical protein
MRPGCALAGQVEGKAARRAPESDGVMQPAASTSWREEREMRLPDTGSEGAVAIGPAAQQLESAGERAADLDCNDKHSAAGDSAAGNSAAKPAAELARVGAGDFVGEAAILQGVQVSQCCVGAVGDSSSIWEGAA